MSKVIKVGDQTNLVSTSNFKYAKFTFDKFNCVQSRVYEYADQDVNMIIAAKTGVGKTYCAEMFLGHEIRKRGGKGMYLAPLKSLASEKHDDWTEKEHHFSELNISMCTGDYLLTPKRKNELDAANLVVMSCEMLNSRCRNAASESSKFLTQTKTIVIDECFPGNSIVRIDNHFECTIQRVYEDDKINTVISYDHVTGQYVQKNILRKIRRERTTGLVRVKHENGNFVCTENHKIWTLNRGYVKAIDLTSDDVVKYLPSSNYTTCPVCDKEFTKHRFALSHYLYCHKWPGANAVKSFKEKKCNKCNKMISVYGFEAHSNRCGKQKNIRYVPKSNVCSICGKEFKSALSRATHEKHHNFTQEYYNINGKKLSNNLKHQKSMRSMGRKRLGANNPCMKKNPEHCRKFGEYGKKRWNSLSEEKKIEQITRFVNAPLKKTSATKLELFVEDVVCDLPISRTSGGKFWLTFKNGKRKNPDFKVNGQRKVVEVGDTEYWHTLEEIEQTINEYSQIGYSCLYLTDKDVARGEKYVFEMIDTFVNNHDSKIISVKKWGAGKIEYVYDLEVEDNHNYFVEGVLVSNCHLLTVPGRGDHLENGIIKYSKMNQDGRIVLLSATMPNVDEIGMWLSKLNGKDTVVLESDYRPVPLFTHYNKYDDEAYNYDGKEESKCWEALRIIDSKNEEKFLVFGHTKKTVKMMFDKLKKAGYDCEMHTADLDKAKRRDVEKRFRSGQLQGIVATSTLAWGVNTPAKNVIILGVHSGMREVPKYDIDQMSGRAGRPGYDTEGHSHILLPSSNMADYIYRLQKPQRIESQIFDVNNPRCSKILAFHLVSEIHHQDVKNNNDIKEWFSNTLAAHQNKNLDQTVVENTVTDLIRCGAVKEEEEILKATFIGKISSMFYFSPFDVSDLAKNFTRMFKGNNEDNDYWIAACLGWVDSYKFSIVSNVEKEELAGFEANLIKSGAAKAIAPNGWRFDGATKTAYGYYCCLRGIYTQTFLGLMSGLKFDCGRTKQVLQAIDGMGAKWDKKDWLNQLEQRIRSGVPVHLLDVARLDGISKIKGQKLYDHGLTNLKEISNNVPRIIQALSCTEKTAQKIASNAREILDNV